MGSEALPSGWRVARLGELGEVNRGRSRHRPRYAAHLYGGRYPFIQTGDIKGSGGRVTRHSQTYSEAGLAQSRLWPAGTLCITIAANIAETAILTYPACFPDSVVGFVADESKCDIFFVEYMLRHLRRGIQHEASGSVQDNINLDTLGRLSFSLPPPGEQKEIVSILKPLDDKIFLNKEMNQTLEDLTRAIFKSWFVDFDPVREEHPLFPDNFEDSVIGSIPLSWQVGALSDLCKVALGGDWGEDEPFEGAMEAACLRGVDLEQLRKAGEASPPHRWIKASSIEKRRMSARDVLVAGSGAGPVGRTLWISPVLAKSFDAPLIYSNFCKRLAADSIDMAIYIDFILDEMRNTGETFDYVTGTSVPNLDLQGLLRRVVPIPPPRVLEAFASIVVPIRERLYSGENRTLAALRDALLPKLLSGEIRVKQAEKIVGQAV